MLRAQKDKPLRSLLARRKIRIGLGGVAVVMALVIGVVIRPVFWSSGGPAAPERFDSGAGVHATFVDETSAAGFTHVHHKPLLDVKLAPIMPWVASVGAAAAAGDFDGDGLVDLYVTDTAKGFANHLYRNLGGNRFVEVAAAAGVANLNDDSGVSTACVWGDYDNDGWLDLFVVKWGHSQLFRNDGGGTFQDVTARAFQDASGKPGTPWANSCAAIWFDYDGDRWLDLYVGNYFEPVDLWRLTSTRIMHDSFETARNGGRNSLYRNNGDGTFTDVADQLGVADSGWTLSVGHGDLNNDGWPELYCANDFGPDQLFLNNADGTFTNITQQAIGIDTKKGMNVDFGDFDGDGWLDIYVANITTAEYLKEGNMLWHNAAADGQDVPILMDVAADTNCADGGWGWGAKFFDFDHDADLDIIAVNGFITAGAGSYWYDLASWTVLDEDVADALNWPPIGERSFSGNEATRLWRNEGGCRFAEIATSAGIADRRDGRGVVVFDSDNDGDLDVYIANQADAPGFYRNEAGAAGNWVQFKLSGNPHAGSNRDAIGARVTVETAAGRQIRELDGGNSYCGQSDRRLHFGLGAEYLIDVIEVRWPSRQVQTLRHVRANQLIALEEPMNLPAAQSLIPRSHGPSAQPVESAREAKAVAIDENERAKMLAALEAEVRRQVGDLSIGSKYRAQCVRLGDVARSIRFYEQLAEEFPTVPNVRLQLAAAYVDSIPACGGVAAVVSKGTLARKSLNQIDMLIAADPNWWPAVYARAVNHLHWPCALLHSADSARDFRRCIELQAQHGEPNARSYYVRSHIGLGDALVKDGDYPAAVNAWRVGAAHFPNDRDLQRRLKLATAAEARQFVEEVRNLEQNIDTDFSFLVKP